VCVRVCLFCFFWRLIEHVRKTTIKPEVAHDPAFVAYMQHKLPLTIVCVSWVLGKRKGGIQERVLYRAVGLSMLLIACYQDGHLGIGVM
jgi:hypothetical protein